MPIQSNLSISPYFDDYIYESDYHRVLFKPATAVQVRELNQLQAILQRQIEEFGDVVLKRGTLLDGCQASFAPAVPFVKLLDVTVDGAAVDLNSYIGLFARGDNANVTAHIINAINGFEAQDPNLKTLYLRYLDSGVNSNVASFAEGETLTIYNNDYRLYDIDIVNGSENFSNSDSLVILSAIEVQNTTGGTTFANGVLQVGETLVDASSNAQVEIVEVSTTANTDAVTLRIKPLNAQLALANTASWTVTQNSVVDSSNNQIRAVVSRIVGSGARANFQTERTTGVISSITLEQGGSGYTTLPFVTISSTTASSSDISTLNLAAENFIARVEIAEEDGETIDNPTTGVGYAMSVTDGKIYQKGHFLRVAPQNIIVSKYSNTQSDVAVGFETIESFANAAVDATLNDNAAGYLNENAPGADRLKLTTRLAVKTFAEAESDPQFFPIYKFSEGKPYSQRDSVQFNKVADELARRTYEESGNYVLNPFEITTRSPIDIANSDTTFTYLIDPGLAYINGYRVETVRNFAKDVAKSTSTTTVSNTSLDLVYGNYVKCNEFVGLHNFSKAQLVELHGTAGEAISGLAGAFTSPSNQIGTARIRSITLESGVPGSSAAVYRIYLFDIRMNTGKNFKNVKSIYSTDGIADIVLEPNPYDTNERIAVLKETKKNSLIFDTKRPVSSISAIKYNYRTSDEALVISTSGVVTVNAEAGAVWPYAGTLTTTEENELIILPDNDLVENSALTGNVDASNTTLTGDGTSFVTELEVGDYIQVAGNNVLITSIANNTSASYVPEGSLNGLTAETFSKVYPKDIPIPLANRASMNASVSGSTLTINTGMSLASQNTVTVVYTQRIENATPVNKPATRKAYVKLDANTHPEANIGPWCLGVPDVFRLRAVYLGTTTSDENVTDDFYIDHGQTENYYGLSYLYKRPNSSLTLASDDELLVEFDCFVRSSDGGVMVRNSYTINDETALSSLTTSVNTLEIPELITKDRYHDLREVFDFRPTVKPTANVATVIGNATTNPAESTFSDLFSNNDIKFPVPESDIFFNMSYYNPRTDTILVNGSGEFEFMIGREPKTITANQFPLYRVNVPPYPSLPRNLSTNVREIADKKLASGSYTTRRLDRFTIQTESIRKQTQGYTMEEIAQLERRIAILEYYTNLSETENRVKELSIPSSVDATIERFKFGFFVDNFSDSKYSDRDDPAYAASIFEYVLQPASRNYNIPLTPAKVSKGLLSGDKLRFPYQRKNLLSQSFATSGPKELPPRPEPEQNWSTVCQNIVSRNKNFTQTDTAADYAAVENGVWNGVIEENIFTLTSNTDATGQSISLKFSLYYGTDRIIVQQSTRPSSGFTTIFSTETGVVETLTEAERRELRNLQIATPALDIPADWLSPDYNANTNITGDPNYAYAEPRGFLKFIGKFDIAYNPANGRYIKVIVQKASPDFLYRICYPGDAIIDPIYNTIGRIPNPTSNNDHVIDGGASPSCPRITHDLILMARGYLDENCNPIPQEDPPILVPPVPEPVLPPEIDDPGEKRDTEEEVYTQPIDLLPPDNEIVVSNNSIGSAVQQTKPEKISDFCDVVNSGLSPFVDFELK